MAWASKPSPVRGKHDGRRRVIFADEFASNVHETIALALASVSSPRPTMPLVHSRRLSSPQYLA